MSEKQKKVCRDLNYFGNFLVFVSAASGCVSVSAFASLVGVSVGISSSTVEIKICAITAGITRGQFSKKKRKKYDKVVLLAKLNTIKVLTSKALGDLYINHDKFDSLNSVLREYNEVKDKIKNSENTLEYTIKTMETYFVSCKKNAANKNSSFRRTRQNRLMLASNCAICGKKKSRFIKNQEASRLELLEVVFNSF